MSANNALFSYAAFVACYSPFVCSSLLSLINTSGAFSTFAHHITVFFFIAVFNSSLNPIVYLSKYREIRENSKRIIKMIFRNKTTLITQIKLDQ